MMSIRTFARSAPRSISRMTAASMRQGVAHPSTFVKSSSVNALRPARAALSTTAFRNANTAADRKAETAAECDAELSAKLESEIEIEEDIKASEQDPASIKDFLSNGPFEIIDTPGQEVVKLIRSFGDEKITVSFSIADVNAFDAFNNPEEAGLEEEFDPEFDMQNPNKQSHVQSTGGARSAHAEEEYENEEMDEGEEEDVPPINLTILVEKPGKTAGALSIDAVARLGNIHVENMFFYEDANVAKDENGDAAHKRASVYPGPAFGSLDEDLQSLMIQFLEERGINSALAIFVPDYVDIKEQNEYLRWLSNVKTFVEA